MKKQNNIPKSFFGFLTASFLIWLLINLSKPSLSVVKYSIDYVGLAQNKILQEDPVKEISLLVKGSGFNLLSANFSDRKIKFFINNLQKESTNNFYLLTDSQQVEIQKQLPSGLSLQDVLQDTIFLKLGSLQSKKVPVVPNLDTTYKLGYNKSEAIKITPDSILISGPELQLKKIHNIQLEKLTLKEVSDNIKRKVAVIAPKVDKVKISANTTELSLNVDKFTEGEFEIPVVIKNIPPNKKINIFPKKVRIIFKIVLKDFSKVTADSFEVVCDYEQAMENELNYLIPKLKSKPNQVSSVRIVPNKIDFLIYK